jgi:hypothetical protein
MMPRTWAVSHDEPTITGLIDAVRLSSPTGNGARSGSGSRLHARREQRTDMATESFRLRPVMRQGSAPSIPETWEHYASIEAARAGAKHVPRRLRAACDGGRRQPRILRRMDRALM